MGDTFRRNWKKIEGRDLSGEGSKDLVRRDDRAVVVITASGTVVENGQKIVAVSGSPAVSLPTSPLDGQIHFLKDIKGDASGNPVTISGNGRTIEGAASFDLDANGTSVGVVFVEDTNKWWYLFSRALL